MTPTRPTTCRCQAMTIVEIIVAMAILSVLMYVLSLYLHNTQILWRETTTRSRMFEQARLVMDVISRDLQGIVLSNEPAGHINYYCNTFADEPITWADGDFTDSEPALVFAMATSNPLGVESSDVLASEVGYVWYGGPDLAKVKDKVARAKRFQLRRVSTTSSDASGNYDYYNQAATTWAAADSWETTNTVLADGVYAVSFTPYYNMNGSIATSTLDSSVGLQLVRVQLLMFDPALLNDYGDTSPAILSGLLQAHLDTFVKLVFVNR